MRHCVRWGPSYVQKKGTPTPTEFVAHVYCGQTAGYIKMPLGTEVDLCPGHTVLDVVPTLAKRAQEPPSFRPMSIVPYSCEDIAGQSCAMVPRWRFFGSHISSAAHFRPAF